MAESKHGSGARSAGEEEKLVPVTELLNRMAAGRLRIGKSLLARFLKKAKVDSLNALIEAAANQGCDGIAFSSPKDIGWSWPEDGPDKPEFLVCYLESRIGDDSTYTARVSTNNHRMPLLKWSTGTNYKIV